MFLRIANFARISLDILERLFHVRIRIEFAHLSLKCSLEYKKKQRLIITWLFEEQFKRCIFYLLRKRQLLLRSNPGRFRVCRCQYQSHRHRLILKNVETSIQFFFCFFLTKILKIQLLYSNRAGILEFHIYCSPVQPKL